MATSTKRGPGRPKLPEGETIQCPHCEFGARSAIGLRSHIAARHEDATDIDGVPPEPAGEAPPVTDQPAPRRPKRKLRDRLRRNKGDAEPVDMGAERAPRRLGTKATKRSSKRVDIGPLCETVYGFLGMQLISSGKNVPLGRTLMFQRPIAAQRADAMVKDTVADHLIQPVARVMSAGEDAGALVGLPVAVMMYQNFPQARPVIEPMMVAAVRANLHELVPAVRKQQEQERQLTEDLAELQPILFPGGLPTNPETGQPLDLVSAIVAYIFGPTEPSEGVTPNDNGRAGHSDDGAGAGGIGADTPAGAGGVAPPS